MRYDNNSVGAEKPELAVADMDYGVVDKTGFGILEIVDRCYVVVLIGACSWIGHIHCLTEPVVFVWYRRNNLLGLTMEVGMMRKLRQILMGRWQNVVLDSLHDWLRQTRGLL